MDPLTQGLLGASLAAALASKKRVRLAALCGAAGGMAPDLDIFISSNHDPLLYLEYHRHFTHSLFFIPIGGALVALAVYILLYILGKKQPFALLYIYTTLGVATHGILDSFTSYGTTLYWPFSDVRESFGVISIIDPIYTSILLIGLLWCLIKRLPNIIRISVVLSSLYIGLGFVQYERVKHAVIAEAQQQNHDIERILLNPSFGNIILWRALYQYDGYYYVNAVYAPYGANTKLKKGKKVTVIDADTIYPSLGADSRMRQDIRRFSHFSQNFIYEYPGSSTIIADLRYGTLPYDDKSLWGIDVDVTKPNNHVTYKNLRHITPQHYNEFWAMLQGIF